MKTHAIVFTAPGVVARQTFDLAPCGAGEIIAETAYSFVSPGTELRILGGEHESKGRFPLIPGYAWVGRVVETGHGVKGWSVGDWVTGRNPQPIEGIAQLWGGQASHHRCQVKGYDAALKLPAEADPWDYVMTEVAAIAWRGVSAAFPAPGETAVVIGQGLIGAYCARWLLLHGARVIVIDLEESRLERARRWGVCAALNGREPDIRERILTHCEDGADIVIEASASPAGTRLAPTLLRQPAPRRMNTAYPVAALHTCAHAWPRIVYQATYTHTLDTGPAGPVGVEGAVVIAPGDRTVEDRLAVIEHTRAGRLTVADFLDAPTPVAEAPNAYATLRDHPETLAAVAFDWKI